MIRMLTMSVIRTAVPLITLLSTTLPSVLQMAVESPIRRTVSPSQVVSPHVNRRNDTSDFDSTEDNMNLVQPFFPINVLVRLNNLVDTTSIAKSSHRLPSRHPAKPIQRTRCSNIEANVNPQEPEISPSISKADPDRLQKLRCRFDRTVLAHSSS
jgi:hypothetical protein